MYSFSRAEKAQRELNLWKSQKHFIWKQSKFTKAGDGKLFPPWATDYDPAVMGPQGYPRPKFLYPSGEQKMLKRE